MRGSQLLKGGSNTLSCTKAAAPFWAAMLLSSPVFGQELADDTEGDNAELALDLTLPDERQTAIIDEECQAQMDAARITGEIVVCRKLGDLTDGSWNVQKFEREYAQRTQGPKNPEVDGSGLILPTEGSIFMVTYTVKFGGVSEQPYIIDFETLPEAPTGSDADRIARGLPPLGGN